MGIYQASQAVARQQAEEYGDSLRALLVDPRGAARKLERLKNLAKSDDSTSDIEMLVELAAYGRALKAEYEAQEVPAPNWLDVNLRLLSGRIKDAHRRQQEGKLRRVEKEIEELRSKEEKKAVKEKEAAELRRALGLDGETAGE
jgi:hypothetical protein